MGKAGADLSRRVPGSLEYLCALTRTFTFRLSLNGFYGYNALQQFAYFATVFIMAPLSILTGMAMSPALVNHFPSYTTLFGGRQGARSIHFLLLLGFIGFIVIHVALVALTGFERNMNHIVLGTDDLARPDDSGLYRTCDCAPFVGGGALCFLVLSTWASTRTKGRHSSGQADHPREADFPEHYVKEEVSPHFWPNGKIPVREDWKELVAENFKSFKFRVAGLVENPVELSLDDLRVLGLEENITMHHCIQGWSGIAQWGGVSMRKLIDHVKPYPSARVVAFYSFGGSLYGGLDYDTQTIFNVLKPGCLLLSR